ncbi:MAG TPA: DUF1844 domain-containing protein [Terriglobales bacterium]|nr:DUF1844 domain-containing protein [Terriglobales bacterium]
MDIKDEKSQVKDELFLHLVFMFQTAALQQMGKLINPVTQKIEKNLEQAKYSIDLLEVLQEKTKGNLKEEEHKYLENVLFELRMNYLDELKKEEPKKAEGKTSEPGAEKKEESKNDEGKSSESGGEKKE